MRRTHRFFVYQLLQIPSNLHLRRLEIKLLHFQVSTHTQNCSIKDSFFTAKAQSFRVLLNSIYKPFSTNLKPSYSDEKPISSPESGDQINKTHTDSGLISPSCIGGSVIYRCSYLWEKKSETFFKVALKDILLKLSDISPESVRKFWRVSSLKPEDVLKILLGFGFDSGKPAIEARKVEFLWKLFNWASEQSPDFEHLPKSYEIMASILIRVGSLKEAECVFRRMESLGFLSGCHEIPSKVIEGYVGTRDLENSISVYNWLRSQGLVLSNLCYEVFLELLIQNNKIQLASRVFTDMVDLGFGPNNAGKTTLEVVVKLLCKEGNIQEARNLVKKVIASGFEPSCAVINVIANGYCEKKDFEDLLNFLSERKCAPDLSICNKILSFQCRDFGTEEAYLFMQELEHLGFKPDEITFGIFISWSCSEGKLKDAFIFLSELLSRHLEPDIYSCNALVAGLFKEGMWKNATDVFDEMLGRRIKPDVSTYRVLLAGYCKFRLFDEAKEIIREMVNHGLIQLSLLEDPLSKAFMILGLNPSTTKVKRDNDAGLWKAEFFDNLGNGLYLETDIDEYEKTLMGVLEDAMVADLNPLMLKECNHGDIKTALVLKHDMICRGQKLSLPAFSALVKGLCESRSRSDVFAVIHLLEEMPEHVYRLDQETLNLIIRTISKKSIPHKGRIILEGMHQRDLFVENETYTALFTGLCKKGCLKELHEFWELARKYKWLPSLKDCKSLLGYLCQHGMLKELLELLESMMETNSHLISDISTVFVEELCDLGFTSIGHALVEEVLRQGLVLDHAAYSHLIRGFCKEKRFHEALAILETMLKRDMTPSMDVCSPLIYQLCRSHKLEKAMDLKDIMLRKEPTTSVSLYCALVNGLCKIHQTGKATLQFQEMVVKGISPDTETYNSMIQGCCQEYNFRRVEELLSIMLRKNISISILTYRSFVSLMCMQGKVLHALSLKEYMVREGKSLFLIVQNILIFHLLQTGNCSLVTTVLDEMQRNGFSPDEFTYNFLVFGYYKCKDFSKSMDALKTMIDKDLRPSNRSLKIIITHLCSRGELDKSLELSRVMELNGWVHGSVVQNAIAGSLLTRGRLQEAENFLTQMEEKDLIPDTINYDMLIKQFCWHGKPNKAVNLLNVMLKRGSVPSSTSYDALIQGLCNCKQLDGALDLHVEMLVRNLKPSIESWEMLVHGLCTDGLTAEAERLLHSMLQLGLTPSRGIYQSVIDRYCLQNNLSKASELLHKMQGHGYEPDFKTHWSLISNLSNSKKENSESGGFLSKLLSLSGFSLKKKSNAKVG
ncbi:Pentatricopeptide repeat [Macleaya cordata]|uniref:Pentatricopeptide repeat n=1 Tax=Macleaya cordata TaxID=56857 RepID=A0A200QP33_MACCD|nr:Pentatricopeptide repeat [Macleaya cordata]